MLTCFRREIFFLFFSFFFSFLFVVWLASERQRQKDLQREFLSPGLRHLIAYEGQDWSGTKTTSQEHYLGLRCDRNPIAWTVSLLPYKIHIRRKLESETRAMYWTKVLCCSNWASSLLGQRFAPLLFF